MLICLLTKQSIRKYGSRSGGRVCALLVSRPAPSGIPSKERLMLLYTVGGLHMHAESC